MRWSSFSVAVVIAALHAGPALADPAACTSAAEQGQRSRAQGKLLDARRSFLVCSATECPAVVAKDCTTWAAEVLAATPTIVVDAKDADGHDVGDATLTIDGKVFANQLDGKAIPVDPGSHVLEVAANNQGKASTSRASQTFIAKEAEKARSIRIALPRPSAESAAADPSRAKATPSAPIWPWVIVGVGAAMAVGGVVMIATAPDTPANCNPDTATCTKDPALDYSPQAQQNKLDEDRSTAGSAKGQPTLGALVLVSGAVIAVGGLVAYLLAKPSPSAMVAPWYSVGSGGLVVRSSF